MSEKIHVFSKSKRESDVIVESDFIKKILRENIPGALSVERAHRTSDKKGTDWWVEHAAGHHISVDAKIRKEDWAAKPEPEKSDDLVLETWSVKKESIGWTRDASKRSDYILWVWKDTGRFCMLPFPPLCKVFQLNWKDWREKYKTKTQNSEWSNSQWWQSECVFVPRLVVCDAISSQYNQLPAS